MSRRIMLLLSGVLVAALPQPGIAQPAQPAMLAPAGSAPPERHGLMIGGGLFGGNISCDGAACGSFREAGGASGHVGFMFKPRLGVVFDLWAMTSKKDDVSITFISSTINLRYYLARVLWVQGGVGNGHARISAFGLSARGDNVPVGELAAGFEVVRARTWAIDVSLKVAQGSSTGDNGDEVATGRSAGIGANFTYFATR